MFLDAPPPSQRPDRKRGHAHAIKRGMQLSDKEQARRERLQQRAQAYRKRILRIISSNPGINVSQIADELGISTSRASVLVKRCRDRGLARYETRKNQTGCAKLHYLTEKGRNQL